MHVEFVGHVGLVFTAFDLRADMRARIEGDVETIFFRENTETDSLLKTCSLIEGQLEDGGYDPSTYFPERKIAQEKSADLVPSL